jgi:hypothetical protein
LVALAELLPGPVSIRWLIGFEVNVPRSQGRDGAGHDLNQLALGICNSSGLAE